jgi:hypothetical protein
LRVVRSGEWGLEVLTQPIDRPGDFRYWTQLIDGTLYGCWYRLRSDGQIEVFARGHHVVLPLDAIALLPESVARALLAQLRQYGIPQEPVGAGLPPAPGEPTVPEPSGATADPSSMVSAPTPTQARSSPE